MKKLFALLAMLVLISPYAVAGGISEISEADTGTYVILGRDNAPINMFYRLTKNGEKWVMDGKKSGDLWRNISCDKGCDYTKVTDGEIETYFPPN